MRRNPGLCCAEECALSLAVLAFDRGMTAGDACGVGVLMDEQDAERCWFAIHSASLTGLGYGPVRKLQSAPFHGLSELLRDVGRVFSPETTTLQTFTVGEWRFSLQTAARDLQQLWSKEQPWAFRQNTTQLPPEYRGLLPGSFNPLHHAHRSLQRLGEDLIAGPVAFELSIRNVEKPSLDYLTLALRESQFSDRSLFFTMAPTFVEKARLFPKTTFLVGMDTAIRILDPWFYEDDLAQMEEALRQIHAWGCSFRVAARVEGDRLLTWNDLTLPAHAKDLFQEIPASLFQEDISSTELRQQQSLWRQLGLRDADRNPVPETLRSEIERLT